MASLPEEAFRRYDETPDEEFYKTPRLVTHIDDRAIAAVTQLYREFFPLGGEILDLMSSWVSHLPPEVEYRRVIGLGMNEAELRLHRLPDPAYRGATRGRARVEGRRSYDHLLLEPLFSYQGGQRLAPAGR